MSNHTYVHFMTFSDGLDERSFQKEKSELIKKIDSAIKDLNSKYGFIMKAGEQISQSSVIFGNALDKIYMAQAYMRDVKEQASVTGYTTSIQDRMEDIDDYIDNFRFIIENRMAWYAQRVQGLENTKDVLIPYTYEHYADGVKPTEI